MNKLISKIGEFFNTEIQPTIGGQLLWLVATVLVTLIVTLFFSQTGKIIKKGFCCKVLNLLSNKVE